MKKKYNYPIGIMLTLLSVACNEDPFSDGGEGSIILRTSINSAMDVVTRAEDENLKENLMVWISNSKGLVRRYDNIKELPLEPVKLVSDHYIAEAWAGDSVPASFDKIYYKDDVEFDVTSNNTIPVNLTLKIANVAAQVKYDDNIDDVLKDYKMTVGHTGRDGKLVYEGREAEELTGYFMMPSFDHKLSYELTGTQIDGTPFKLSGQLEEDVVSRTKYILNVKCNEKTNDVGGLIFTIQIDKKELDVTPHDENIVMAPKISGYGFDINNPIVKEQGTINQLSVYVSTSEKLSEVVLESELISKIEGLSFTDFDLIKGSDTGKEKLKNAGIYGKYKDLPKGSEEGTLYQIVFTEDFTNELENGDYSIKITAKDDGGRTSEATLTIIISEVPVLTTPLEEGSDDIGYYSVTLRGMVTKDGTDNIGFRYHKLGDSQWTYIEAQAKTRNLNEGDEFFAVVKGLDSNSTYEYKAVSGETESIIQTFKTKDTPQLPNSSFEDWCFSGVVQIPGASYGSTYWDSGNHGSTKLGGSSNNLTTPDTQYVHNGSYSACLKSKFVGITSSLGKLAAGNIFVGKFLGVVGVSDGATGFGRPFTEKPKSVKLWVKYEPGSKTHRGSTNYLKNGKDEGQIFIALTDSEMSEYNGEKWPFIVNTGTKTYFDSSIERVIAYGEKIFTEATEGEGLIQIEIPLDYKRSDRPSNIIFVASASRYGDYFEGYEDSTMWLDEIELIYED